MSFTSLKIAGVWLHTPKVLTDARGSFHEAFKLSEIERQLGRNFEVKQANLSVSSKGVIRGIHSTNSSQGQAKYVSCPKGAIWDIVVDLRPGSPTFGQWDSALLSDGNKQALLISEGLGHAFLSLEDETVAQYLCTSYFDPTSEVTIDPFDKELGIAFEMTGTEYGVEKFTLSEKDKAARSLREALQNGYLDD